MHQRMELFLSFLSVIFIYIYLHPVSAGVNLTPVQECPRKEKLWKEKAKKYNCSEKHNNTLRTYHCIRDNNENVVETCLKRMKIPNGKVGCPWINRGDDGSITFGTVQTVCDDILSCPNSNHTGYFSDELYKYPGCIQTGDNGTKDSTLYETAFGTDGEFHNGFVEDFLNTWEISITIYCIVVFLLVAKCIWLYKKNRSSINDEQSGKSKRDDNDFQKEKVDDTSQEESSGSTSQTYYGIGSFHLFLMLLILTTTIIEATIIFATDNVDDTGYVSFYLKECLLIVNLLVGILVVFNEYKFTKYFNGPIRNVSIFTLFYLSMSHAAFVIVGCKRIHSALTFVIKCQSYPYITMVITSFALVVFVCVQSVTLTRTFRIPSTPDMSSRFQRMLLLVSVNGFMISYTYSADVRVITDFDRSVFACVVKNSTIDFTIEYFFKTISMVNLPFFQLFSFFYFLFCVSLLYKTSISVKLDEINNLFVNNRKKTTVHLVVITVLSCLICFSHLFFSFQEKEMEIIDNLCLSFFWQVGLIAFIVAMRRVPLHKFLFIDFDRSTIWDCALLYFYTGAFITYTIRAIGFILDALQNKANEINIIGIFLNCISLSIFFSQTYVYFLYSALVFKTDSSLNSKLSRYSRKCIHCMSCSLYAYNLYLCIKDYYGNPFIPTDMHIPTVITKLLHSQFLLTVTSLYRLFLLVEFIRMGRKIS